MAEETKNVPTVVTPEVEQKTRRTFVRTAAAVAVTAPAVAVLLSATNASAQGTISQYQAQQGHLLDDYTYGNTFEDIDALKGSTDLNNFNASSNATESQDNATGIDIITIF